ncbi:MAG: hypothetical protein V2A78_08030 [bacterium]
MPKKTRKMTTCETMVKNKLEQFLKNNPSAELREKGKEIEILRPWNDETIALRIDPSDSKLIDALNSLYFPPRFTAIWHKDTDDIEFIFTALPTHKHLYTRHFSFQFERKSWECEYADASDRLMTIAKASKPIEAPTTTNHRNLQSFSMYLHLKKEHPEQASRWHPLSFWIRKVGLNEERLPDLCQHINFFMNYFDFASPAIDIHEPPTTESSGFVSPWKPSTDFPAVINGRKLDPFLLQLWESSQDATDVFRRFLYCYQIIEYCAFYHVQENVLAAIGRALLSPDLNMRSEEIARDVLEAVTEDKVEDARKVQIVISRHVDPRKLWVAIEANLKLFSAETSFDGGLKIQALTREQWTFEDFKTSWDPRLVDSLRTIRNGLVHAREKRMTCIISPTRENANRLRHWFPPLKVAARELLVFSAQCPKNKAT